MPIVRYQEADVAGNRKAQAIENRVAYIDTDTGHIMDAKGNPLGKWDPVDSTVAANTNAMASEYAANYVFQTACSAQATAHSFSDPTFGKERAATMLCASGRQDDTNPVATYDLGTGDVHIPSALPNYAAGYRNEAPMADLVSPPLLVPKMTDYYYTFAKEDAFQRAYPSGGAPGGATPEINPRLASSSFTTVERALGGFVPTQIQANADAPLRIIQAGTKRVLGAMLIEREIRVQSLLRTTSNWGDSTMYAVTGAAYKWNGGASADPVQDLLTRERASWGGVSGILMSKLLWDYFVTNPAVRAYYAFKSNVAPMPKPSDMEALLQLPPIYVSKMRYINSSGVLTYIWGTDAVLFRQPEEMPPVSQDDVATSYTFRWNQANGQVPDGSASGGFLVRQFFVQDRGALGGLKVVVTHQDAEVMTSAWVGGLITVAYQ